MIKTTQQRKHLWPATVASRRSHVLGRAAKYTVEALEGRVYFSVFWDNGVTYVSSAPGAGDNYGQSVALADDYLIVGAPDADRSGVSEAGIARLYEIGVRSFPTLTASRNSGDDFAWSVATSTEYAVVGAPRDDSTGTDSGAVFFKDINGPEGSLEVIPNFGPGAGDGFGYAVAVADGQIIIGTPYNHTPGSPAIDHGTVYFYDVAGAGYRTVQNPELQANAFFGYSIAALGDRVVVGAPGSGGGAAYVLDASSTQLLYTLQFPNSNAGDRFGASVAISEKYVIVGAPGDRRSGPTRSGAAYVYDINDGSLLAILTRGDAGSGDEMGFAVGITGNQALVGVPHAGGGRVEVFNIGTGDLVQTIAYPGSATVGPYFGGSIAATPTRVAIGAPADIGLSGILSGCVYVYEPRYVSIDGPSAGSVVENGTATFTVRRSIASSTPLRVNLGVAGSARGGADYDATGTLADGYVDIPAFATSATITIPTNIDGESEYDETITLTVTGSQGIDGYTVDPASAESTVTIVDGDLPLVELEDESIAGQDFTGVESTGDVARFRLRRHGNLSVPLSVGLEISGTATLGNSGGSPTGDYSLNTGSTALNQNVTFPVGAITIDLIATPNNDATSEGIEWIVASLTANTAVYSLGAPTRRVGKATILDDEIPTIRLEAIDNTLTEAGPTGGTLRFTRMQGGISGSPAVTVKFSLGGNASAGGDYSVTGATFDPVAGLWLTTLTTGQTQRDVTFATIDDSTPEPDETLIANLTDGDGYRLHPAIHQAQLSLVDDDRPTLTIIATDASASEPGENRGEWTIFRSGNAQQPLQVNLTVGGSALYGIDYQRVALTQMFAANQTELRVTLIALEDSVTESTEMAELRLLPAGGYELGGVTAATVSIQNRAAGAPDASFDWSMAKRYGLDSNDNARIDLPNSYSYANPSIGNDGSPQFPVTFDAATSTAAGGITSYLWSIYDANGTLVRSRNGGTPTFTTALPEALYVVELAITDGSGLSSREEQLVQVNDILIVSMGDSFSSGEGNPDRRVNNVLPANIPYGIPLPSPDGTWADGVGQYSDEWHHGAHRSSWAMSSLAAMDLENADPKSSVTYINLAQSGASIPNGMINAKNIGFDGRSVSTFSQIEEAKQIVGERKIDALLMSIGINDVKFSSIVADYVARAKKEYFWGLIGGGYTISLEQIATKVQKGLTQLPGLYASLHEALNDPDRLGDNVDAKDVYLVQYPDGPTRGQNGEHSQTVLADYSDNIYEFASKGFWTQLALDLGFGGIADAPLRIDPTEGAHAVQTLLSPLNSAVRRAALQFGWNTVSAPLEFRNHGYANEPWSWFRTATDSRKFEGGDAYEPAGSMHPNEAGHRAMANTIITQLGGLPGPTVGLPATAEAAEGTTIGLTASTSGSPGLRFEWDFDYDGHSFSPNPRYRSATAVISLVDAHAPDVRQVAVRAIDRLGRASAVATTTVRVVNSAIVRVTNETTTLDLGEAFRLNLEAAGDAPVNHWRIDWGDGTIETVPGTVTSRLKTYSQPRAYQVRVYAADAGGEDEVQGTTVTVLDTGPMPAISIVATDASASEIDSNSARFTVTRTGSTTRPIGVAISLGTGLGFAVNGTDFGQLPLWVFIPAGASSATLDVVPLADAKIEGAELVAITINPSSLYSYGPTPSATATITDGPDVSLAIVSGRVFNDADGDGVQDAAEAGVAGRLVFDDADGDGARDAGEVLAMSNATGDWTLPGLLAGEHAIVLAVDEGSVVVGDSSRIVTLAAGELASLTAFGVAAPAGVAGRVFSDTNVDGEPDAGEPGVAGWRAFVDMDFDGLYDSGEPQAMTGSGGDYLIAGVVPGDSVVVRVEPVSGFTGTNGDVGGGIAIVALGGVTENGVDLGVRRAAPAIAGLTASTNFAVSGRTVTFTPTGVDLAAAAVRFYRESNGQAGLQTGDGGDLEIAGDLMSGDGWSTAVRVGWQPGTYTIHAAAVDALGLAGIEKSTRIRVTGSPVLTAVGIAAVNHSVREGGSLPLVFEVRRTGNNADAVTVNLGLVSGVGYAVAGDLLDGVPTSVVIPAGQDAVRVTLIPASDALAEANEQIGLRVLGGGGYSHSTTATAKAEIRDAASAAFVRVNAALFEYDATADFIRVELSEDVLASIGTSDVTLVNLTTGNAVSAADLKYDYDTSTGIARFAVPGINSGMLAGGRYRLTLSAAGITDSFGNMLDGNGDGIGGDDYHLEFSVTSDLATRRRRVERSPENDL